MKKNDPSNKVIKNKSLADEELDADGQFPSREAMKVRFPRLVRHLLSTLPPNIEERTELLLEVMAVLPIRSADQRLVMGVAMRLAGSQSEAECIVTNLTERLTLNPTSAACPVLKEAA